MAKARIRSIHQGSDMPIRTAATVCSMFYQLVPANSTINAANGGLAVNNTMTMPNNTLTVTESESTMSGINTLFC